MTQLRVLVVARWFPSSHDPSAGTFVRDWAEALSAIADVTVLHAYAGRRGEAWKDASASTSQIDVWRQPVAWRGAGSIVSHLQDHKAVERTIRSLHRRKRFDVVHVHSYVAAAPVRLAVRRAGVPYVVTEHFSRLTRGDIRWYHRVEAWYAFQGAAAITAVGPTLARAVERIARRGVDIIPNPVPGLSEPAPLPPARQPFRLLSVGRLEDVKGLDVGLRALARLREGIDARWTILGDGGKRQELHALASRLGLSEAVSFEGAVEPRVVRERMAQSHVVVVPSRVETFSVVAAEALMSGRPVVVTRSGGPEEFIGHGQGRVVEVDDAEGLAAAISAVLEDLSSFEPPALAAYARARFSAERVAEALHEILMTVVPDRIGPR